MTHSETGSDEYIARRIVGGCNCLHCKAFSELQHLRKLVAELKPFLQHRNRCIFTCTWGLAELIGGEG